MPSMHSIIVVYPDVFPLEVIYFTCSLYGIYTLFTDPYNRIKEYRRMLFIYLLIIGC